jgi:periplasmic copper chaperone A
MTTHAAKIRALAGTGLALGLLLGLATPAFAHVTTDPSSAPQGGEITLGFRVPNEETSANVVKIDIAFPTNPPLLGVDTEAVPGWTSTVTNTKLNPPVQTDDGPVVQAVSEIVWTAASGGGTPPGSFQEFYVLVQQLPTSTTQVVFKAIQTYSDASVVSWIDPVVAGQPDPDHPTPILQLTPAGSTTAGTPTTTASAAPGTTIDVSQLAKKSAVSSANTLGIIGIIVGALGVIVAGIALTRRPATG